MNYKILMLSSHALIASFASLLSLVSFNSFFSTKNVVAQPSDTNFKLSSWSVINSSLSELLNSGWKITAQSSHRVATVTTNGVGAFDETTFVYTLSKGSKYITCLLYNPVANKGGYTACRAIN
jgi:hypothetical protein